MAWNSSRHSGQILRVSIWEKAGVGVEPGRGYITIYSLSLKSNVSSLLFYSTYLAKKLLELNYLVYLSYFNINILDNQKISLPSLLSSLLL